MKTLIFALLALIACPAVADISVIVHTSNSDQLDKKMIERIYFGKEKRFPSGGEAVALSLEDSETIEKFSKLFLGRTSSQYKAYWSKLVFTGKGTPPREIGSDAELVELVSKNPQMIGFVNSNSVSDGVRVVMRLEQ